MKKSIFSIIIVCFSIWGYGQSQRQVPCSSNPIYQQFDFWIGDWEAFDLKGNKAGDSKIERILDSCVILENWTGVQGNYRGKSYNTYNASTGKWQQYWVDNKGGIIEYFDGHFEKDKMRVQTANLIQSDGKKKILKMTFFKINSDTVRQFGENSTDDGKTWNTDFDLEYRRKK